MSTPIDTESTSNVTNTPTKDKVIKDQRSIAWDIAVLEAKLGIEPSIPKAQFFAKKIAVSSLFTPEELKDNGSEPSKREIQDKIERLKQEKSLEKISELKKTICKELKDAIKHENLRLLNKIKKLDKDATNLEVMDQYDFSLELKFTKSIVLDLFSSSMVGAIVRKNRLLAEHPHMESFKTSGNYEEAFIKDSEEINEDKRKQLVSKISQRLLSSKILSSVSARIKTELFEYFGLSKKEPPKKSKPATKSEDDGLEGSDKDIVLQRKESKKSSSKNMSESLFVGKLGDFDEEDQEFKELYGIKGKNRPGQRQRRKMIEEKYGQEANHVKSKVAAFKPRESTKPKVEKRPQEKLHPSWEAKKKQKLGISLSDTPQNKKIVFD